MRRSSQPQPAARSGGRARRAGYPWLWGLLL